MDYEFKLFAGLSLKQFIYIAVSGGFSFGLYELNRLGVFPTFFAWLTIPVILIVGIALGLGGYQKRGFEEWFSSFSRTLKTPLRRVWKKGNTIVKNEDIFKTKPLSLPNYLAIYFLNPDEYRKLMRNAPNATLIPNAMQVQDQPAVVPTITLASNIVSEYADPGVTLPSIPNTIAFKVEEDNLPVEGVVAYVKDAIGTVLSALRSNKDGIIYFNQGFSDGIYDIDFQGDAMTLPKVHITFDGTTYPLINLTPIE